MRSSPPLHPLPASGSETPRLLQNLLPTHTDFIFWRKDEALGAGDTAWPFYLPVGLVPFGAAGGRAPGAAGHSPALREMRGQRSPEHRHPRGFCASPHPEPASSFDSQPFLKAPSPAWSHKASEKHSRLRFSSAAPGTCRSPGVSGAEIAQNPLPPQRTRVRPLSQAGNRVEFPAEPHICLKYCPMK